MSSKRRNALRLANTGVRLAGGGASAPTLPVPVLGSELIVNGDFAAWSGNNPTGWTVTETPPTHEVTEVDPANLHGGGGTGAANFYGDLFQAKLTQNVVPGAGTWLLYQCDVTAHASGAVHTTYYTLAGPVIRRTAGAWLEAVRSAGSGAFTVKIRSDGTDMTIDNVSLKTLTLASLLNAVNYGLTHATTKAAVTVTAATQAGVVANLDSTSSPANFVIATHDGTTARLTKCVNGTYTDLVAVAATYAAGATIEIRRLAASNTYQLWYNGTQRGTDQTISDAGIVSNVLAGYFNTYSGNTLTAFSCTAAA